MGVGVRGQVRDGRADWGGGGGEVERGDMIGAW